MLLLFVVRHEVWISPILDTDYEIVFTPRGIWGFATPGLAQTGLYGLGFVPVRILDHSPVQTSTAWGPALVVPSLWRSPEVRPPLEEFIVCEMCPNNQSGCTASKSKLRRYELTLDENTYRYAPGSAFRRVSCSLHRQRMGWAWSWRFLF